MKVTNVYGSTHLTSAQKAKEKEAREMFQDWKPGPEELLASGRWQGPIIVEGQQEFWQAIRKARAYREAQGLTLRDVSDRCGIDVATLSKLENGKQANPTLFTMLLYIGALGKRLHFSVQARPPATVQSSETHTPDAASNGATRTAGRKSMRRKAKMPVNSR